MVQGQSKHRWYAAFALVLGLAVAPEAWAVHEHCGDGVVDADEACDDGNRKGGDGCSATCHNEMLSCGIADPSAASCGKDEECGIRNECVFDRCTPSICGCSGDSGPIYCTKDCQGRCVEKEPIVCADETRLECSPRNKNADVLCVDLRGEARPRPNGDKCWSAGDCGPTGLCIPNNCVGSTCFCSPGHGWSCTEDCVDGGLECRYPGDDLPPDHPICLELTGGVIKKRGCIYPAQAQELSSAPALGGFGVVLGLGLGFLGLRRRRA